MVGKSYPPEFYSWIKDSRARNAMERVALETEEDYQSLIKILEKFNVDVIRPDVTSNHEEVYNEYYHAFSAPPMTPRDHIGVYNNNDVFLEYFANDEDSIYRYYNNVKDDSWPYIKTVKDLKKLPQWIISELRNDFNLEHEININRQYVLKKYAINAMNNKLTTVFDNVITWDAEDKKTVSTNNAGVSRIGKDLYFPKFKNQKIPDQLLNSDYRINLYSGDFHADSCFVPVVPGLIISLHGYQNYKETFPGWEVVYLPDQSWNKVKDFLRLKNKNKGKWWVPGQEDNDALTETVEQWLGNWVGFVEETVFDVNMLVINEKNVVVNNYNELVFDALERHGVTPHICNFRHRYFWDGGLHCITADLDREGEMNDYFPERDYKIKEF
jgi:N-dimethylarginine dimethylaminohydrolase